MPGRALRGRIAFGFALGAVVYSVALIVWVVAIPSIDGEPLLSYGGALSLVIAAQSLPVSLLVFALLRRRCTTTHPATPDLEWVLGGLFLVWSFFGGLTVAFGAFPTAVLVILAIGLTPRPVKAMAPSTC